MDYKGDFNIFVGTKLGLFKAVKLEIKDEEWRGIAKSLRNVDALTREDEICELAWGDKDEREIILGYADRSVKVFETDFGAFSSSLEVDVGKGKLCGLGRCNRSLVVATESGHICIQNAETQRVLEVPGPLEKMKLNPKDPNIFVIGGKETDLEIWDLEQGKSVFKAKNVRHDSLELRVPIWISDLSFIPNSENIATASRHGHIRIYDPRGTQRRPVFNFEVKERSLTACDVTNSGNHIVFGSATGHMGAVDVRASLLSHTFKGAVGSVRGLAVHPNEPFVISTGLDRFLRVHHFETRALLHKEFMMSKCTCVLVRTDFFYEPAPKEKPEEADSDIEVVDLYEPEQPESNERKAYNKLFDQMEAITEGPKAKRLKKKA